MLIDQLTAAALLVASLFLAMRQILLSSHGSMFPRAPWLVQTAMFLMSATHVGLALLFLGHRYHPFAGEAAWPVLVLAVTAAGYNGIMFANVLSQRQPVYRLRQPVWHDLGLPRPEPASYLRKHHNR